MRFTRFFKLQHLLIATFFCLDFFAVVSASLLSYSARFELKSSADLEIAAQYNVSSRFILVLVSLGWLLALALNGTYSNSHSNIANLNLRMIFRRSLTYFFLFGFLSFIFKASFSRGIFVFMFFSGITMIFIFRTLFLYLVVRKFFNKNRYITNLIIIGTSDLEIEKYTDWIIKNRQLGYKVKLRLICETISYEWIEFFDQELEKVPDPEILLLPGMESDPNFAKFLHYLEDLKIHLNWVPLNSGNFGYWQTPAAQEGSPFLTFLPSDISLFKKLLKRLFDIFFALMIVLMISPLLLAISMMIYFSDGRPIIFSQSRIGKDGKPFKFLKFRSMVKDAEKLLSKVPNMHDGTHVLFKSADDPRVTKLGKVLRRYSLDELPQFFNVLNNSMSIVGPRPALPKEVSIYDSTYERRLIAKPGITGPWQISGRSDLDLQTSVSLDLNYLKNWSFTKDLWIIFSTIGAILKGKGAY
jgi:exopolysaccharide biosynthesis polyprenyl glycosylphosphotransferase